MKEKTENWSWQACGTKEVVVDLVLVWELDKNYNVIYWGLYTEH